MKKELLNFISENKLSPFNNSKTTIPSQPSIYRTRDAKSIHQRVLSKISENFFFAETSNLLYFFKFTENIEEIKKRQDFFSKIKSLERIDNLFLKQLSLPRKYWKPRYDVLVVTESPEIFTKLKNIGCPVKILISENDVALLESYDVVQVIDCPEYSLILESLPQSVFLKNESEAYLERHLEEFSGWKENFNILNENKLSDSLQIEIENLNPLFSLIGNSTSEVIDKDDVELKLEKINDEVNEELRKLTLTGESLIQVISKGILPDSLKSVVIKAIQNSKLPQNIMIVGIPVKIDEEELEKTIQAQNSNEFSNLAEKVKERSNELRFIPEKIEEIKKELIIFDFISGVSKFIKEGYSFPVHSEDFSISNSKNIFFSPAQSISFSLNNDNRCSILTGANSGGKTTLIEHVIQVISLFQLGIPVSGSIRIPMFSDIYYFAKNKGSMSKGAFETLLSQLSTVKSGSKTLILADEIEAVTEPGVAGDIISATADYYIKQNCFLIIATHLGHEIKNSLPEKTRIDGIEAKGLDENFELIVDHNPVLGRLAHSTPELIVEKMANNKGTPYFIHLNDYLKNKSK